MGRVAGCILIASLVMVGCERAQRYRAAPEKKTNITSPNPTWSWLPTTVHDKRIIFVTTAAKEFTPGAKTALPFWSEFPPAGAGVPIIHVGLDPLGAVVAMACAKQLEQVRIRAPLGLPDPTPFIPAANPPTVATWQLGRDLFFAPILTGSAGKTSCAECHRPEKGFTDIWKVPAKGTRNTLSLINCVYHRRQFWDGRVGSLEEVVVRSLDDEKSKSANDPPPETTHRWGGMVKTLDADGTFRARFREVFGIEQPTQDAIAKALATYLRTILSGDSIYDRAEAVRQQSGAADLDEEHFRSALDAETFSRLQLLQIEETRTPRMLFLGYQLFTGKAGCVRCHSGPLFTDGDFHNIGLEPEGGDPGRIAETPIGLKESRLHGAFRTPTLRNLPRTAPYFHKGSFDGGRKVDSLKDVIGYYNAGILAGRFLARELLDPQDETRGRMLHLSEDEARALEAFLYALEGAPVDPMVAAPPSPTK